MHDCWGMKTFFLFVCNPSAPPANCQSRELSTYRKKKKLVANSEFKKRKKETMSTSLEASLGSTDLYK